MSTATPVFAGWRAAVLHRPDEGVQRLVRQLELLGLVVVLADFAPLGAGCGRVDVVFVDADQGFDGLLPWSAGAAPVPVVALLQSEAPGRISWAMAQGAGAMLPKPVAASAVYPSLVLAAHAFAERTAARARIAELEERLRLRPVVFAAARAVADGRGIDEQAAFRLLRRTAMRRRLTIEQVSADVLAGLQPLPEVG